MSKEQIVAAFLDRYPEGVTLTANGLRQVVERSYDAGHKAATGGVESEERIVGGFEDLLGRMFKGSK